MTASSKVERVDGSQSDQAARQTSLNHGGTTLGFKGSAVNVLLPNTTTHHLVQSMP